MTDRQQPLALVTGASSGIGLELARACARGGFEVLLSADEQAPLTAAHAELRPVATVVADLAQAADVERLAQAVWRLERPLEALVLNAGTGAGGAFVDIPLTDDLRVVDVNVRAVVHLAKLLLPDMVARRRGRVLLTSSIAAGLPGTRQATYDASKAFLQSFGVALREELRDSAVTVTLLLPGPTDTSLFARAPGMAGTLIDGGPKDDPADVARAGFDAMLRGDKRVVAASLLARAEHLGVRLLPDAVKARLMRVMARPRG